MPLVELEDTVLENLKKEAAAAAPYRQVWGKILSGKNRIKALELVAEDFPDAADVKAELSTIKGASEPVLNKLAEVEKQFADYREEQAKKDQEREDRDRKDRVDRSIGSAHRKLKADGWDDEGIKKIEEVMVERGVNDYDIAAAYVKSQIPVPSPLVAGYEGKDLNWFNPGEDEPDHKLLMDNPKKFKSDMIKKFFSDRASGNMAAWSA
jgi:hypothetical protein